MSLRPVSLKKKREENILAVLFALERLTIPFFFFTRTHPLTHLSNVSSSSSFSSSFTVSFKKPAQKGKS